MMDLARSNIIEIESPSRVYMISGEEVFRIDDFSVEFVDALLERNTPNLAITSQIIPNETRRNIFGVGFTNGLKYVYEWQISAQMILYKSLSVFHLRI